MEDTRQAAMRRLLAGANGVALRDPRPPSSLSSPDLAALDGAGVLVTGAGHGIGRDTALVLSRSGSVVVAADIDAAAVADTARQIRAEGGQAHAVVADISREEDVDALARAVSTRLDHLDIVVNNAAIIHVDKMFDTSLETWQRVLGVNVMGTFLVTRASVMLMRAHPVNAALRRRGMVVNISSLAGEFPRTIHIGYGASKAAVNYLAKAGAVELLPDDISTAVVCPRAVREGMWRELGTSIGAVQGRSRREVEDQMSFQPSVEVAEIVRDLVATPGLDLNGALILPDRQIVDI